MHLHPENDSEHQYEAHKLYAEPHPLGEEDEEHSSTLLPADRWTRTATNGSGLIQGDPITLTWNVVPDGTHIPGFVDEPAAASNLRSFLNSIYGNTATWLPLFASVFARWSELSGIHFVFEANDDQAAFSNFSNTASGVLGVRADIRIGGHHIDGDSSVLAYNFFPNIGDTVIDTSDLFYNDTSLNSLALRNVVAHETGHGLGFEHVESDDADFLLEPLIYTSFDGPQFDEILNYTATMVTPENRVAVIISSQMTPSLAQRT